MQLSAREVQEAIEERILRGTYPRGAALPSVRRLATELGSSPSTVGRALQFLERRGWVEVESRRGAVVAARLPSAGDRAAEVAEGGRRLALRWRLAGLDRESFEAAMREAAQDVFRKERRLVFLECNRADLERMAAQVERASGARVEPMLLEEAAAGRTGLRDAALLTPFFHLREARELAPKGAEVVPLNFVPSEETLLALTSLPPRSRVLVVGANERSRRRLDGLVQQYAVAGVRSVLADDPGLEKFVEEADAVVTTHAAELPRRLHPRSGRVILVTFGLEAERLDLPGSARLEGREEPEPAVLRGSRKL